jgi:hypothetical protein
MCGSPDITTALTGCRDTGVVEMMTTMVADTMAGATTAVIIAATIVDGIVTTTGAIAAGEATITTTMAGTVDGNMAADTIINRAA